MAARALIVGASGYGNVGDDTYRLLIEHYLGDKHSLSFRNSDLPSSFPECDVLVIAGGGLLYPHPDHFDKITWYIDHAMDRKIPYAFVSCGYGFPFPLPGKEFDYQSNRIWAKYVRNSAFMTVRSARDKEYTEATFGYRNVHYFPNLCYCVKDVWPAGQPEPAVVIVPVRDLVMSDQGDPRRMAQSETLRDLLDAQVSAGRRLHVVRMGAWVDDRAAVNALAARYPQASLCTSGTPTECYAVISSASLVITGRYHGLVFARAAAVPFVRFPISQYKLIVEDVRSDMARAIEHIRVLEGFLDERRVPASRRPDPLRIRPVLRTNPFRRYRSLARDFIRNIPAFPSGKYSGRGIVMCAGGGRYFTCAWVAINMLRYLGCRLPLEVWHLGPGEMTKEMISLLEPLFVRCVDGRQVRKRHPARILNGYELKPYSIIHSSFKEVLLLDADNVPVVNPEFLFDTGEYHRTGAIFWPDYGRISPKADVWQMCEVPYRDEPEFESGQIVVDKGRCWSALLLTMHYNEFSDEYYRHFLGDKETFHMAWRRLRQAYSMPPYPVRSLAGKVMGQRDFSGRLILQHRSLAKWTLDIGKNLRIPGFVHEKKCLTFLEELASKWHDKIP